MSQANKTEPADNEAHIKAIVATMDEATVAAWVDGLQKRHTELHPLVDEYYRVDRYLYILRALRGPTVAIPDVYAFDTVPPTVSSPAVTGSGAAGGGEGIPAPESGEPAKAVFNQELSERYPLMSADREAIGRVAGGSKVYVAEVGRYLSPLQAEAYRFFVDNDAHLTATQLAYTFGMNHKTASNFLNRMVRGNVLEATGSPRVYSAVVPKTVIAPVRPPWTSTPRPATPAGATHHVSDPAYADMLARYPVITQVRRHGSGLENRNLVTIPEFGIKVTEFNKQIYYFLRELGRGVTATEFAAITGLNPTSISGTFNRMAQLKLLNLDKTTPRVFSAVVPAAPAASGSGEAAEAEPPQTTPEAASPTPTPTDAPAVAAEPAVVPAPAAGESEDKDRPARHAISGTELEEKVKLYLNKFPGGHTATDMTNHLARYGVGYSAVNTVMRNLFLNGEIWREEGGRGKFFLPQQGGRPFRAIPGAAIAAARAESTPAGRSPQLPAQPAGTAADPQTGKEPQVVTAPPALQELPGGLVISARGLTDAEIKALIDAVPPAPVEKPTVLQDLNRMMSEHEGLLPK